MIAIPRQPMNNQRLDELLRGFTDIVEGELGFWRVTYEGRDLLVITDESHNRMRVMTPAIEAENLQPDDYQVVLAANFDRALDAKYALSGEYLWSVFTHPLAELTDDQLIDAVKQVKTLADNYGTTYSSSDLVFGG